MGYLALLFLVWIGFALWAKHRQFSGTVAWGGGFVAGLSSVAAIAVVMSTITENQPDVLHEAAEKTISQANLIQGLHPFTPELEVAESTEEKTRAVGKTTGGSVGMLEVSGKALDRDIESATLAFAMPDDNVVKENNVKMAGQFIRTLFPEWVEPEAWLTSNVLQHPEEQIVEREGRQVRVRYSNELSLWFMTVKKL